MKTKLAKRTGFCFGVKRAIDMAESALKENEDTHSLGSIIHNRQVVDDLSQRGLKVVDDVEGIRCGAVVVSSHGISPKVSNSINSKGLKMIDTTCPFVLKAQRIARSLSEEGYKVIIVGEAEHPEVKALVDFASKDVYVVKDAKEAGRLKLGPSEKISIIAQTTQSKDNFLDVVNRITKKRPRKLKVINTICRDVDERQDAARALTKNVDVMLIVGGRNSANTKRLYEICKKILKSTYLIETEQEIDPAWFKPDSIVGITSGASTPDRLVKRAVDAIQKKGGCAING